MDILKELFGTSDELQISKSLFESDASSTPPVELGLDHPLSSPSRDYLSNRPLPLLPVEPRPQNAVTSSLLRSHSLDNLHSSLGNDVDNSLNMFRPDPLRAQSVFPQLSETTGATNHVHLHHVPHEMPMYLLEDDEGNDEEIMRLLETTDSSPNHSGSPSGTSSHSGSPSGPDSHSGSPGAPYMPDGQGGMVSRAPVTMDMGTIEAVAMEIVAMETDEADEEAILMETTVGSLDLSPMLKAMDTRDTCTQNREPSELVSSQCTSISLPMATTLSSETSGVSPARAGLSPSLETSSAAGDAVTSTPNAPSELHMLPLPPPSLPMVSSPSHISSGVSPTSTVHSSHPHLPPSPSSPSSPSTSSASVPVNIHLSVPSTSGLPLSSTAHCLPSTTHHKQPSPSTTHQTQPSPFTTTHHTQPSPSTMHQTQPSPSTTHQSRLSPSAIRMLPSSTTIHHTQPSPSTKHLIQPTSPTTNHVHVQPSPSPTSHPQPPSPSIHHKHTSPPTKLTPTSPNTNSPRADNLITSPDSPSKMDTHSTTSSLTSSGSRGGRQTHSPSQLTARTKPLPSSLPLTPKGVVQALLSSPSLPPHSSPPPPVLIRTTPTPATTPVPQTTPISTPVQQTVFSILTTPPSVTASKPVSTPVIPVPSLVIPTPTPVESIPVIHIAPPNPEVSTQLTPPSTPAVSISPPSPVLTPTSTPTPAPQTPPQAPPPTAMQRNIERLREQVMRQAQYLERALKTILPLQTQNSTSMTTLSAASQSAVSTAVGGASLRQRPSSLGRGFSSSGQDNNTSVLNHTPGTNIPTPALSISTPPVTMTTGNTPCTFVSSVTMVTSSSPSKGLPSGLRPAAIMSSCPTSEVAGCSEREKEMAEVHAPITSPPPSSPSHSVTTSLPGNCVAVETTSASLLGSDQNMTSSDSSSVGDSGASDVSTCARSSLGDSSPASPTTGCHGDSEGTAPTSPSLHIVSEVAGESTPVHTCSIAVQAGSGLQSVQRAPCSVAMEDQCTCTHPQLCTCDMSRDDDPSGRHGKPCTTGVEVTPADGDMCEESGEACMCESVTPPGPRLRERDEMYSTISSDTITPAPSPLALPAAVDGPTQLAGWRSPVSRRGQTRGRGDGQGTCGAGIDDIPLVAMGDGSCSGSGVCDECGESTCERGIGTLDLNVCDDTSVVMTTNESAAVSELSSSNKSMAMSETMTTSKGSVSSESTLSESGNEETMATSERKDNTATTHGDHTKPTSLMPPFHSTFSVCVPNMTWRVQPFGQVLGMKVLPITILPSPPAEGEAAVSPSPTTDKPPEKKRRRRNGGGWPKGKKRKTAETTVLPKPPATAYGIYLSEQRQVISEGLTTKPSMSHLSKTIGRMWSQLPAHVKQEYNEKAAKDRRRYLEELKAHLAERQKENSACNLESATSVLTQFVKSAEDNDLLLCRLCKLTFTSLHNKQTHYASRTHTDSLWKELNKLMDEAQRSCDSSLIDRQSGDGDVVTEDCGGVERGNEVGVDSGMELGNEVGVDGGMGHGNQAGVGSGMGHGSQVGVGKGIDLSQNGCTVHGSPSHLEHDMSTDHHSGTQQEQFDSMPHDMGTGPDNGMEHRHTEMDDKTVESTIISEYSKQQTTEGLHENDATENVGSPHCRGVGCDGVEQGDGGVLLLERGREGEFGGCERCASGDCDGASCDVCVRELGGCDDEVLRMCGCDSVQKGCGRVTSNVETGDDTKDPSDDDPAQNSDGTVCIDSGPAQNTDGHGPVGDTTEITSNHKLTNFTDIRDGPCDDDAVPFGKRPIRTNDMTPQQTLTSEEISYDDGSHSVPHGDSSSLVEWAQGYAGILSQFKQQTSLYNSQKVKGDQTGFLNQFREEEQCLLRHVDQLLSILHKLTPL